jgi:alpha-glucosidase
MKTVARTSPCNGSFVFPRLATVLLAATVAIAGGRVCAAETQITSPDGNVVIAFDLKEVGGVPGCPVYRVNYRGKPVLGESRLGLQFQGAAPLDAGFGLVRVTRSDADTTWKPVCGERSSIRDHYNQAVFELQEDAEPHRQLQVTFRAYDEGVAFCYTLPEQPGLKDFTISLEETQFHFTGDYTTWAVYSAQGDYTNGEVPLSKLKPGVERPLTVRVADDLYASITEARTVDYARMKLRPVKDEPDTLEAFLDAEHGKYGQVTGTTPFTSPWRVVMAADSPGKLLEYDYLILNLNDPCTLADVSWITPGKAIRETTLTTAGGKACVDFCLDRGMQFIELDAGWYGKESDPKSDARAVDPKRTNLNLQEVIDYANSKSIGVILYVNHVAMEKQLDEILPLYHKWGVKGVKYGFVNVGSQHWTSWLHEAIRKAADNRLMVDIHDEFRNTGYQRTYPNLMSVEGIGGDETFPTPAHNATLPFTRFLTGPADHTFCWYSGKLKTTHAHQLAISTIFFSPWQFLYWYDRPSQYKGEPELDYWKALPTTWDETRVVQGDIARRVTVARRKGDDWFVGSINPGGPAQMEIPLAFLTPGKKYTATVYSDKEPEDAGSKAVKIETMAADSATVLKAEIGANGGQAVRIVPATG